MPGYDQTGPMGQGARSGRGLGRCNGNRLGNGRDERTTRVMQRLRRRRCRRDAFAPMDAGAGYGGRRQDVEGAGRPFGLRGQGTGGGFGGGGRQR
ncbi:DUF5320 domain-containing protein [Desulfatitalea alkaliphila]|uniref:DUF5320 domain-containing protein n=1 Tax=Desulfatitalea alkaliphila TaxID=2929485 RepID=UPI003CCFBEDC